MKGILDIPISSFFYPSKRGNKSQKEKDVKREINLRSTDTKKKVDVNLRI